MTNGKDINLMFVCSYRAYSVGRRYQRWRSNWWSSVFDAQRYAAWQTWAKYTEIWKGELVSYKLAVTKNTWAFSVFLCHCIWIISIFICIVHYHDFVFVRFQRLTFHWRQPPCKYFRRVAMLQLPFGVLLILFLGPVHTKTIVNANDSKRIILSPSTRRRSSFT